MTTLTGSDRHGIIPAESNRGYDFEQLSEGKVWIEVSQTEVSRLMAAQQPDRRELPSAPPGESEAEAFIKRGMFHPRNAAQAAAKAELDLIHYIETADVYVRRVLT